MESTRQTWSDERRDEFAARLNILFGALATGFVGAGVSHFLG